MRNSEEAEALACRQAIVFALEAGFSKLVIEGDKSIVMKATSGLSCHNSLLGHVYEDICAYLHGMQWVLIICIKRGEDGCAFFSKVCKTY